MRDKGSIKNAGLYSAGSDSLYSGLFLHRLNIPNEAAEKLAESGRIRASYIDGEDHRITEPAVRIFLGEF